ncbi:AAA family ATPase [Pseudomonas putida]|nr:AAA family ATPase [Pseudomonas putida]
MKLLNATFKGLPGIEKMDLAFNDVNVFVGPNGAGKSTVLNLLKFSLDLLSRHTIGGLIGEIEEWLVFETAELLFEGDANSFSHFVPEILEAVTDRLMVTLRCQDGRFYFESLRSGAETLFMLPRPVEEVDDARAAMQGVQSSVEEHKRLLSGSHNNQTLRDELGRLQNSLKGHADRYEESMLCEMIKAGRIAEDIDRGLLDGALAASNFPAVVMVESGKAIERAIPRLIESMCGMKSGKRSQNRQFEADHNRLEHLLQHNADFYEKGDSKYLTIDGVDYRKSSSGTQVSLAYFGLTNFLRPNDIIVWDEPENGLHPTRRIRILDLILSDERQFFIATHAMEFAPILAPKGKIFRCDSDYEEDADNPTLSITEVSGRKEEFLLLEALGVQPARTLFTASVVIWVEGPTELVFYRHWLAKALQEHGLEEGFHYTIMHYGGGLISYLGVADDVQMHHAFDALSICRKMIISVDSDLREAVEGDIDQHLKAGAVKMKEQIGSLNQERPGAGLFSVTGGREIENYLPPRVLLHAASQCWDGYRKHEDKLVADDFSFAQYDSFETALELFFINAGASKTVTRGEVAQLVGAGKTQWGAVNKVEMMRAALTYEDLEPSDLRWGFSEELAKMVKFIREANAT